MKSSLHEISRPAFVPLRDAVLCFDCQFITSSGSKMCSVCGGRVLLGVAQILDVLLEEVCGAIPTSRLAGKFASRLQVIDSRPAGTGERESTRITNCVSADQQVCGSSWR